MKRGLLLLALMSLAGCKKDRPAPPPPAAQEEFPAAPGEAAREPARADQMGTLAAPKVKVTSALLDEYLAYRKRVAERGQTAVEKFKDGKVDPGRRAEEFAVRMRAIEEKARQEAGLSRDEVVATGQLVSEVFAQRQIWKLSGGDEVLEKARAKLASLPAAEQQEAKVRLAKNEQSFQEMKTAQAARRRFGDAAVDAVLEREDALWKVQQDGAKVMAAVY